MKEFIGKYQKAIVGTGAVAVLILAYFQQKELVKLRSELKATHSNLKPDVNQNRYIDSLVKVSDSLYSENFNNLNAVGKYELALEHLYEVNPKAAKQFDEYLQNETE
jgi:negative regulator of replication initiation